MNRRQELYDHARETAREEEFFEDVAWHAVGIRVSDAVAQPEIRVRNSTEDAVKTDADLLYQIVVPHAFESMQEQWVGSMIRWVRDRQSYDWMMNR